ncbi:hypothetical protein SLA2020_069720 [Shorea laevis]
MCPSQIVLVPYSKKKTKDVEVNSRHNHLLDASIGQNNSINIELNGDSCVDEKTIEDGMGLVEKWDRLIHGSVNSALDTLGVNTVLKVPLSQEFGSIRGENRKRCG